MAHKLWCGLSCSECNISCSIDNSISCSPDCNNLSLEGHPIDNNDCKGCDALS